MARAPSSRRLAFGCFGAPPNGCFLTHSSAPEAAQHPALLAFQDGSLSVSFSGGGFLLPYFVGVMTVLRELGVLKAGSAVAGSSAGSLVAAGVSCGLSAEALMSSFMTSVHDCRRHGTYQRLSQVVQRQLESVLPPDAHERCSGSTTVGVTELGWGGLKTRLVSSFHSRDDLIKALLASCHIPRYCNGELTTVFRGTRVMDGGITALIPTPHAHVEARKHGRPSFILKVSCFCLPHVSKLPVLNRKNALKHLEHGILPGRYGEPWPHPLKDTVAAALEPATDAFLEDLLKAGQDDTAAWAAAAGFVRQPGPLGSCALLHGAGASRKQPTPDQQQQDYDALVDGGHGAVRLTGHGQAGDSPAQAVAAVVAEAAKEQQ